MAEANEPPEETMRRELREELGVHGTLFGLLVVDWVAPHGPWEDQPPDGRGRSEGGTGHPGSSLWSLPGKVPLGSGRPRAAVPQARPCSPHIAPDPALRAVWTRERHNVLHWLRTADHQPYYGALKPLLDDHAKHLAKAIDHLQ
jgi:8-oxo-dGTP pyrophosphatase MutT (NUDIX family)